MCFVGSAGWRLTVRESRTWVEGNRGEWLLKLRCYA